MKKHPKKYPEKKDYPDFLGDILDECNFFLKNH